MRGQLDAHNPEGRDGYFENPSEVEWTPLSHDPPHLSLFPQRAVLLQAIRFIGPVVPPKRKRPTRSFLQGIPPFVVRGEMLSIIP